MVERQQDGAPLPFGQLHDVLQVLEHFPVPEQLGVLRFSERVTHGGVENIGQFFCRLGGVPGAERPQNGHCLQRYSQIGQGKAIAFFFQLKIASAKRKNYFYGSVPECHDVL